MNFLSSLRKLFGYQPRPVEPKTDIASDEVSAIIRERLYLALEKQDSALGHLQVASRSIRDAADAMLAEVETKRWRRHD
jgi:hypothetical protein